MPLYVALVLPAIVNLIYIVIIIINVTLFAPTGVPRAYYCKGLDIDGSLFGKSFSNYT